jgi:hypothetical protein
MILIGRLLSLGTKVPGAAKLLSFVKKGGSAALTGATVASLFSGSGLSEDEKSELMTRLDLKPEDLDKAVSIDVTANRGFLDTVDDTVGGLIPDFLTNMFYGSDRSALQEQAKQKQAEAIESGTISRYVELRDGILRVGNGVNCSPAAALMFVEAIETLLKSEAEDRRAALMLI